MRITDKANNGQILMAYKELKELTTEEREGLGLPYGEQITDYADFQVRYNKKGKLLGVQPNSFTNEKRKQLRQEQYNNIDVLDWLTANFKNNTGVKPWFDTKKAQQRIHYANANRAIKERQEKAKAKKRELKKCN